MGTAPEWVSQPITLPANIQEWDEVQNAQDPEAFWKQITDQRSHLGQSIRIPSQDAGAEDWKTFNTKLLAKVPSLMPKPDLDNADQMNAVYTALGRPESPDKYVLPEVDNKGLTPDMAPVEAFRKIAHEAGISNRQFQTVVKAMSERNITDMVERQQRADQNVADLKTEWGAAFDTNYKAVTKFLADTKAPQHIRVLAEKAMLDKDMAVWFLGQLQAVQGEGARITDDKSFQGGMTPADARARISEINNNPKHAYHIGSDPGHRDALMYMVKLQKLARGEKIEG